MATVTEFPFVEQIEDEAMALLLEARGVLTREVARRDTVDDAQDRWMAAHRNFEVTTRLSWVVAWVFFQKAVRAGELTPDEARARLPALTLSSAPAPDDAWKMPDDLADRLQRSRALYDRAAGLAITRTQ